MTPGTWPWRRLLRRIGYRESPSRGLLGALGKISDDFAEHRRVGVNRRQPLVRACRCIDREARAPSAPSIAESPPSSMTSSTIWNRRPEPSPNSRRGSWSEKGNLGRPARTADRAANTRRSSVGAAPRGRLPRRRYRGAGLRSSRASPPRARGYVRHGVGGGLGGPLPQRARRRRGSRPPRRNTPTCSDGRAERHHCRAPADHHGRASKWTSPSAGAAGSTCPTSAPPPLPSPGGSPAAPAFRLPGSHNGRLRRIAELGNELDPAEVRLDEVPELIGVLISPAHARALDLACASRAGPRSGPGARAPRQAPGSAEFARAASNCPSSCSAC